MPVRRALPVIVVLLLAPLVGCSDDGDDRPAWSTTTAPPDADGGSDAGVAVARPADAPLPGVVPTPHELRWLGDDDVAVPGRVALVAGDGVDAATVEAVGEVLRSAGASTVEESAEEEAPLVVEVGLVDAEPVTEALSEAGVAPPADLPAEGYVLAVDAAHGSITIGGRDAAGAYYGAQTLRQLAGDDTIAGVAVVDSPTQARRGVVEGFYGSPWTLEERLDQLDFYGRTKLNTYLYAPKADPYHRDRWREPYPAAELDGIRQLAESAAAHHVAFDFAVSPGVSICYSDPAHVADLEAKLGAVYDLGVRRFTIALDDIAYDQWNCTGDRSRYGANTGATAAQAQVDLLNGLQQGFVAQHEGTAPLTLVPTEYRNTDDSPYKQVVGGELDPEVQVMWTGDMVVPAEITAAQATAAGERFGRPVLIWDNYPVNDFERTAGRLLLGPYARREPAMASQVTGVIANPMNQAAASKVALVGVADFTWNGPAYDPARAHRAAAEWLATDPAAVDALLAFFDLSTYSPTSARSESVVSQAQAPVLAEKIAAFEAGDEAPLRAHAELLAAAPEVIRAGVADEAFLADCRPWLDALVLWGQALVARLDGRAGDVPALVAQARAVHTIEGETLPQGPVRLGDGVLDRFLEV